MIHRPATKASARESASVLRQLERTAPEFGTDFPGRKTALLRKLRVSKIIDPKRLIAYHDLLCFVRAYPEDKTQLDLAEAALRRFGERIAACRREKLDGDPEEFENSGLVDTTLVHPYSYDLSTMLVNWYRGSLEMDWDTYDDNETGTIAALLPLCVLWQENDTLDNDFTLETRDWLAKARARKNDSDLETILNLLAHSGLSRHLQRSLFESGDLPIKWKLGAAPASRTLSRLPFQSPFYQTEPMRQRTRDLRAELRQRPAPLRRLPLREAERYVRRVNEVLAVRVRELFCITGANPREVYTYEPGRGVQIAIFGSKADIRLPLEANFGALLVRNGLPVGYGVAAVLFDRVEIAINVFPVFRGGESSFIIEQFFKLFYHHFGSRVFLVRSRQMGDGDDEPIQSGAFWFYNKLGFRPVKRDILALAERERTRIAQEPGYRCSVRMLKRLSKSDVVLTVDPRRMESFKELSLINLGYRVTDLVSKRFGNDRARATRESVKKVVSALHVSDVARWTPDERIAIERLAPLVSLIKDLSRWSPRDKNSLASLIRAKGGQCERSFVRRCNEHPRFRTALEKLARLA